MDIDVREPIGILRSEADYEAALVEFESYFDDEPPPGSAEADRFELLGLVLARYEEARFPMPAAEPVEVLKVAMAHNGRSLADLARLLGSRSRASELLARKRDLTLDQIRRLTREWRIPAAALIGDLEQT